MIIFLLVKVIKKKIVYVLLHNNGKSYNRAYQELTREFTAATMMLI